MAQSMDRDFCTGVFSPQSMTRRPVLQREQQIMLSNSEKKTCSNRKWMPAHRPDAVACFSALSLP
jgi:hypothetical protein